MAPKIRITKESIISTAIDLVRVCGEQAINARAIATALDCSTQPIFSNFASMDELRREVMATAYGKIYL
jgi:AcrR family transcriptional regulator